MLAHAADSLGDVSDHGRHTATINLQFLTKTSRILGLPVPLTDRRCPPVESKKRQNILTRGRSRGSACAGRRFRRLAEITALKARAHLDTLKQQTEAEGRDFAALTSPITHHYTGIPSPDGSRRPFPGQPDEIAGDIEALRRSACMS